MARGPSIGETHRVNSVRRLLLPSVLAVAWAHTAHAAPLDPEFSTTGWWGGTSSTATGMAWAPDGSNRLFVATQDGTVWVVVHPSFPRPADGVIERFAAI